VIHVRIRLLSSNITLGIRRACAPQRRSPRTISTGSTNQPHMLGNAVAYSRIPMPLEMVFSVWHRFNPAAWFCVTEYATDRTLGIRPPMTLFHNHTFTQSLKYSRRSVGRRRCMHGQIFQWGYLFCGAFPDSYRHSSGLRLHSREGPNV